MYANQIVLFSPTISLTYLTYSVSHSSLKSSTYGSGNLFKRTCEYLVKFRYCENATKHSQNIPIFWRFLLNSNIKKLGDFFNFVAFTEYLNFSWCRFSLEFQNCPVKKRNVLQKVSWTLWPILLNYISRNHFSKGWAGF